MNGWIFKVTIFALNCTDLLLSNEHCDRGIQTRTQGHTGGTINLELVNDTLRPLRRVEHLDVLPYQPDSVGL